MCFVKVRLRIVVDIFILTMEQKGTRRGARIVWKRYQDYQEEGGRGNLGQLLLPQSTNIILNFNHTHNFSYCEWYPHPHEFE